jgi:hypothetical protein
LKREAQYPLPNGLMGQHIINQQGGAFCHSPRATAQISRCIMPGEIKKRWRFVIVWNGSLPKIFMFMAQELAWILH